MTADIETQKQQARAPDAATRAIVASDETAPPELLYFLTTDKDETVRAAAAGNISTPVQTVAALVEDESRFVRAALGRKLARILPDLGEDNATMAFQALYALVKDTAVEVRTAIAATLQNNAFLPPKLALELARDGERAVAGPVLRFCLTLADQDLVALIKTARHEWIPLEIAHRAELSETVTAAVWESGNIEATEILLANKRSVIKEPVMDEITEESSIQTKLQPPLVTRPDLTPAQTGRLAEFVDGALLETLAGRAGMDEVELQETSHIVRRRLDFIEERKKESNAAARAKKLHDEGKLDDAAITDAIAWSERDFIIAALALKGRIIPQFVEKVLSHQSPKGITAICFKAGISMRTCRLIQIRTAHVPATKALLAKGGFDYPLTPEEIRWQLEFYGIS